MQPLDRLTFSNLAAQSAEQLALAAGPIVAVLALGAGVAQTGLLSAAQTLPFLLFSLPAGLLADRMRRRRLMVTAELIRAAALAGLAALVATGWLSIGLLAIAGALTATGTVVFSIAAPALLPSLVDRADLARGNTRLELARSLAFAAGPPLAGSLVGLSGAAAAFALAAALSASAAVLLSRLPDPAPHPGQRRRVLADVAEGLRFVRHHPLLRPIMVTAVFWNVAWFVLQAAYVPFAVTRLGLDAAGIGMTLGAYGIGMVAGALAARALSRRMPFGAMIATGPAVSVLAALCLAGSGGLGGPILPALGFFLFGAGPILWTIGQTTLRQAVTPAAMLGRVSALTVMATAGARPIGAALGALVGTIAGLEVAIWLATIGFLVQAAVILLSPVRLLATVEAALV